MAPRDVAQHNIEKSFALRAFCEATLRRTTDSGLELGSASSAWKMQVAECWIKSQGAHKTGNPGYLHGLDLADAGTGPPHPKIPCSRGLEANGPEQYALLRGCCCVRAAKQHLKGFVLEYCGSGLHHLHHSVSELACLANGCEVGVQRAWG